MKTRVQLNVRTKLTVLFSLLFGIVSLILYFYIPSKLEVFAFFSVADKARSIDEIAAYALAPVVNLRTKPKLDDALNRIQQNHDFIYAVVTDTAGATLASKFEPGEDIEQYITISSSSSISPDGLVLNTFAPVVIQGKTIGLLHTGYSLQGYRQEIQGIKFSIAITCLIMYIMGVFMVAGIASIISRPYRKMVTLADQFGGKEAGSGSYRTLDNADTPEGSSLHRMVDALDFAQSTLENINNDLERRIDARTKQLVSEIETRRTVEEQLHKLSIRLQSIREEERKWISREIHDELGQALTGLKMYITGIQYALKDTSDTSLAGRLGEKLQSMGELVDTTLGSTQRLVSELRPPILDRVGLVAGIEWYINQFIERTNIHCEFTSSVEDNDIPPDYATPLFRVVQETMTNVARHANASEIKIMFTLSDGIFVIEIQDNGKGITIDEINSMNSLGLLGMRERIAPFHGEVYVSGTPGKGTLVVVRMPMEVRDRQQTGIDDVIMH